MARSARVRRELLDFARDLFRAQAHLEDASLEELDALGNLGWQESLLRVAAWLRETALKIESENQMELQVKARSVGLGKASTGSTQVAIEFYVQSKGRFEGQTFTWYGSLVPGKATEITTAAMRECGWSGRIDDLESCKKNSVRISLEENERGNHRVRSVFPLKRKLFKEESEFSAAEMADLQAQIDGVSRTREPGEDDIPYSRWEENE